MPNPVSGNGRVNEKITINLDTLEREDTREEFAVVVEGRRVVISDPSDHDWKTLMNIDRPDDFFRHVVSKEDQTHFKRAAIPGWKMRALMESYTEHYGLDSLGNVAGSRTS
jgi:hypothetical protein